MEAQLIILCINWGADNTEEQQRELGHAAIEEGAGRTGISGITRKKYRK